MSRTAARLAASIVLASASVIAQDCPLPELPKSGLGSRSVSIRTMSSLITMGTPEKPVMLHAEVFNRHSTRTTWNAVTIDVRMSGSDAQSPHFEFVDFAPMAICHGRGGFFVVGWDERDGTTRLEHWSVSREGGSVAFEGDVLPPLIDRRPMTSWRSPAPVINMVAHPHVDEVIVLSGFGETPREVHSVHITSGARTRLDFDVATEAYHYISVLDLDDGSIAFVFAPLPELLRRDAPRLIVYDRDRNGIFDRSETLPFGEFHTCFGSSWRQRDR